MMTETLGKKLVSQHLFLKEEKKEKLTERKNN